VNSETRKEDLIKQLRVLRGVTSDDGDGESRLKSRDCSGGDDYDERHWGDWTVLCLVKPTENRS